MCFLCSHKAVKKTCLLVKTYGELFNWYIVFQLHKIGKLQRSAVQHRAIVNSTPSLGARVELMLSVLITHTKTKGHGTFLIVINMSIVLILGLV